MVIDGGMEWDHGFGVQFMDRREWLQFMKKGMASADLKKVFKGHYQGNHQVALFTNTKPF